MAFSSRFSSFGRTRKLAAVERWGGTLPQIIPLPHRSSGKHPWRQRCRTAWLEAGPPGMLASSFRPLAPSRPPPAGFSQKQNKVLKKPTRDPTCSFLLTPFGKKGTQYSTLFSKGDRGRTTAGGMADDGGASKSFRTQKNPGQRWSRSATRDTTPTQLGSQWHGVMGVKPIRNPPLF